MSIDAGAIAKQMQTIATNQTKRADATLTAAQQLAAQTQPKAPEPPNQPARSESGS